MIVIATTASNKTAEVAASTQGKITEVFKIGQILDAVTLNNSRNGQVNIRIANSSLDALTSIPLKQNTHLLLRVEQLNPALILKTVPSSEPVITNPALKQAIAHLLPKQMSLLPLLSSIAQKENVATSSTNMVLISSIIKQINNQLPDRKVLMDSKGLKQSILNSGLFFEAENKKNGANTQKTGSDLKSQLLKLLRALSVEKTETLVSRAVTSLSKNSIPANHDIAPPLRGTAPSRQAAIKNSTATNLLLNKDIPVLLNRTQAALSRISLLQVATLENFNDGQCLWQIEVPIKHNDTVEHIALNIEKENKNNPSETDSWRLSIALDLPRLGAINLHIQINQQNISSTLWSESDKTLNIIKPQLKQLRASLSLHGFEVTSIKCQKGVPPASSTVSSPSIIDIKI